MERKTILTVEIPEHHWFKGKELKPIDRCDSCEARAVIIAYNNKTNGELTFCAHHANKFAEALMNGGWSIDDQSVRVLSE